MYLMTIYPAWTELGPYHHRVNRRHKALPQEAALPFFDKTHEKKRARKPAKKLSLLCRFG